MRIGTYLNLRLFLVMCAQVFGLFYLGAVLTAYLTFLESSWFSGLLLLVVLMPVAVPLFRYTRNISCPKCAQNLIGTVLSTATSQVTFCPSCGLEIDELFEAGLLHMEEDANKVHNLER